MNDFWRYILINHPSNKIWLFDKIIKITKTWKQTSSYFMQKIFMILWCFPSIPLNRTKLSNIEKTEWCFSNHWVNVLRFESTSVGNLQSLVLGFSDHFWPDFYLSPDTSYLGQFWPFLLRSLFLGFMQVKITHSAFKLIVSGCLCYWEYP